MKEIDWNDYDKEGLPKKSGLYGELKETSLPVIIEDLLSGNRKMKFNNLCLNFDCFELIIEKVNQYKKNKDNSKTTMVKNLEKEIGVGHQKIMGLEKSNESNLKKVALLKERLTSVLEELVHSTASIHAKNPYIKPNKPYINAETYSKIEKNAKIGNVIPPTLTTPATQISELDSVLPHVCTNNSIVPFAVNNGHIWMGWNKSSTTGDTMRVVQGKKTTRLAICDGAGGTGISGKIFSRVLAGVISEYIPLSIGSPKLLSGPPMAAILREALRHKPSPDSKEFEYTKLYRDMPLSQSKLLKVTVPSARSTALNIIIHATGYFWYSGLGDTHLSILRTTEDGKRRLEEIYTTNNEDDDTELIGLDHYSSPERTTQIEDSHMLAKGDILVAMTDHAADFASKYQGDFIQQVEQLCDLKLTKRELISKWDLLIEAFDKLETDDDISVLMYLLDSDPVVFEEQPISYTSKNKAYTFDGDDYKLHKKNYYWNGQKKGLKKIPRGFASNLLMIQSEYETLPSFIPHYEIYQTETKKEYFMVMDHLDDSEYTRLDDAIEDAKSVDDIEFIQTQLTQLKESMEKVRLLHCDIAPTNIFLPKKPNNGPKLVDLNTLYFTGCFPLDVEKGHTGMYGDDSEGFVPSERIHILPFKVLFMTLDIIKSNEEKIEDFIKEKVNPTADEEYLLKSKFIRDVYLDTMGEKIETHRNKLLEEFPLTPPEKITQFLQESTQSAIFNFFS